MSSKAERTRQYIIEQTAAVFNTKGFAGTSLSDITVATGLTKGSVYGNFENKDEVALAVFDYNFGRVVSYLRTEMLGQQRIIDKLLVYPNMYRHFLQHDFLKYGCPIANTATEADDTHVALKQKAAAALLFWKNTLEHQICKGIELGELKQEINPAQTVAVFTALMHGAMLHAKLTHQTHPLHSCMNFLTDLILELKA